MRGLRAFLLLLLGGFAPANSSTIVGQIDCLIALVTRDIFRVFTVGKLRCDGLRSHVVQGEAFSRRKLLDWGTS
jgi:hypothetical protein